MSFNHVFKLIIFIEFINWHHKLSLETNTMISDHLEVPYGRKRGQNVYQQTNTGPSRSLFTQFLVIRISQIDHKAIRLVEIESLLCPTTVHIKRIISIEWSKPLEPSNYCLGNSWSYFDPYLSTFLKLEHFKIVKNCYNWSQVKACDVLQ